jgi:hypothetical protein
MINLLSRRFLWACAFALLALRGLAFAPHPTVLTVKYQEQLLPVVKVRGASPIVVVNGQEVSLPENSIYALQPAPGFGAGYVEAPKGDLGGAIKKSFLTANSGPHPSMGMFETSLVSKKGLAGGFIVVVGYSRLAPFISPLLNNQAEGKGSAIMVHELPDLPVGQAVSVKFTASGRKFFDEGMFFVQIFDGDGREVVTNGIENAWGYLSLRELFQCFTMQQRYLAKYNGADHDASPFVMPKPLFKEEAVLPKGEASALLTISDTGQVTKVDIHGVDDADARKSIESALEGWLFMPKLKAGKPVESKINVPLQF